jgi:hypothetical protein
LKRRPDRTFLSASLILGALVLLVAIVVGNQLGDRVLSQVTERTQPLPTLVIPTAVPAPSEAPQVWKSAQVTAVATDPHFPDPRVTPPPPPTPRPTPTPRPAPTRSPALDRMFVPAPPPVPTGPARGPLPFGRPSPTPTTPVYFPTPTIPT